MYLSTESYTCTLMSLVWAVVDTLSGKVDMSAHFILYIEMMMIIIMIRITMMRMLAMKIEIIIITMILSICIIYIYNVMHT